MFIVDALLVWVGQQVVGLRMRTLRSLTQRAGVRGDGVPHLEFHSALQHHCLGVPHCLTPYLPRKYRQFIPPLAVIERHLWLSRRKTHALSGFMYMLLKQR